MYLKLLQTNLDLLKSVCLRQFFSVKTEASQTQSKVYHKTKSKFETPFFHCVKNLYDVKSPAKNLALIVIYYDRAWIDIESSYSIRVLFKRL